MRGPLALLLLLMAFLPASAGEIVIGHLAQRRPAMTPVSPLDGARLDEGVAGARLGIADNNATGRFTGQSFRLAEAIAGTQADLPAALDGLMREGARILIADLDGPLLRDAMALPQARDLLVLNSRAPDDDLRAEHCAANLLHTAPSRAMLADALAQYFAVKRWKRWFLIIGQAPGDAALGEALRRAAQRFGAQIVAEKAWTFRPGQGRTDTGYVTLQSQIPAFTQVEDHDVVIAADEADGFGDFLPGRTALPRPVAGTQGLVAAAFSPVAEQWGATQLQSRFQRQAGRRMEAVDYTNWLAARAVGEAATRARADDPAALRQAMTAPDFLLAGFKGQGHSFRPWDGQMRQPILIAGPRVLVSVSPQPGFLHRVSTLDTLGFDREESRCRR